MEKVLIAGANGLTGRHITGILKDHGHYEPVAMIRKKEQESYFHEKGINTVLADLEEDLSDALNGIDKVIFAAGSGASTGPEKTIAIDQEGAVSLIDEAKKHNVKKFIMLSAMGADDPQSHEKLKNYLQAKHNADEHLKESGLNYTIVRPGQLTKDEGDGTVEISQSLDHQGKISRKDVARVLVSCLDHANVKDMTFELLEGNRHIEEALADLD